MLERVTMILYRLSNEWSTATAREARKNERMSRRVKSDTIRLLQYTVLVLESSYR